MANDRRDKSGLAQQFQKLKQQVSISLTPIARAKRSLLWILLGAFLQLKVPV
ncbi:MAG: hypothetical protein F6K28_46410 [Microcoleus sp. SIO2G3]|nr:hypothetical protein [Microcoleus sp. SIO2G3]